MSIVRKGSVFEGRIFGYPASCHTTSQSRPSKGKPSGLVDTTVSRGPSSLPGKSRPSALPRSTSSTSAARLESLASTRALPSRLPAPITNSRHSRSVSEDVPLVFDAASPPMRRDQQSAGSESAPMIQSAWDMAPDMIFGLAVPEKRPIDHTPDFPARLIPELQALAGHRHYQQMIPPSSISTVSSPSTRFTESPAPWSASTAATTPVSWPSTSPAAVQMNQA